MLFDLIENISTMNPGLKKWDDGKRKNPELFCYGQYRDDWAEPPQKGAMLELGAAACYGAI